MEWGGKKKKRKEGTHTRSEWQRDLPLFRAFLPPPPTPTQTGMEFTSEKANYGVAKNIVKPFPSILARQK